MRVCAYQGVRNVNFSENIIYVINEWSLSSLSFIITDLMRSVVSLTSIDWHHCKILLSVNWDETQARPHFKLVNMNFKAFVQCSSELNWILKKYDNTVPTIKTKNPQPWVLKYGSLLT